MCVNLKHSFTAVWVFPRTSFEIFLIEELCVWKSSKIHLLLYQPSRNDVLGKNSLERSWEKLILIKRFWISLQHFFSSSFWCFSLLLSLPSRWLDDMTSRPFGMPLRLGSDDEEAPVDDPYMRGARRKK